MRYNEYEIALSPARLNRYMVACRGNKARALQLYPQQLISSLTTNGTYTNDRIVSGVRKYKLDNITDFCPL